MDSLVLFWLFKLRQVLPCEPSKRFQSSFKTEIKTGLKTKVKTGLKNGLENATVVSPNVKGHRPLPVRV
jgi:hypothetical protein